MAVQKFSLRDTIRVENELIDYAHRLAQEQPNFEERRKRYHVPPAVEVSPTPNGIAAIVWVPFLGLLAGIWVWRWITRNHETEERDQRGL